MKVEALMHGLVLPSCALGFCRSFYHGLPASMGESPLGRQAVVKTLTAPTSEAATVNKRVSIPWLTQWASHSGRAAQRHMDTSRLQLSATWLSSGPKVRSHNQPSPKDGLKALRRARKLPPKKYMRAKGPHTFKHPIPGSMAL